jgi:hypothetical protein
MIAFKGIQPFGSVGDRLCCCHKMESESFNGNFEFPAYAVLRICSLPGIYVRKRHNPVEQTLKELKRELFAAFQLARSYKACQFLRDPVAFSTIVWIHCSQSFHRFRSGRPRSRGTLRKSQMKESKRDTGQLFTKKILKCRTSKYLAFVSEAKSTRGKLATVVFRTCQPFA